MILLPIGRSNHYPHVYLARAAIRFPGCVQNFEGKPQKKFRRCNFRLELLNWKFRNHSMWLFFSSSLRIMNLEESYYNICVQTVSRWIGRVLAFSERITNDYNTLTTLQTHFYESGSCLNIMQGSAHDSMRDWKVALTYKNKTDLSLRSVFGWHWLPWFRKREKTRGV